jgi:hypothetical protein
LLQVPGQILNDLLLASLDFEQDWLRHACEANPHFGCAFFQRMFTLVADRMQSAREQLAKALAKSKP